MESEGYEMAEEDFVSGLGSVWYIEAPIDFSTALFERIGNNHITARDLAFARINSETDHSLCRNGSFVREGVLYVPKFDGVILVRDSLVLKNPKGLVEAHRNGEDFFIDKTVADEYIDRARNGDNSVFVLKDFSAVPTGRFGEDERTVWLYQDIAQEYGEFLEEYGKPEMPLDFDDSKYINEQEKPFANQAAVHSLSSSSEVNGVGNLNCSYRARWIYDKSGFYTMDQFLQAIKKGGVDISAGLEKTILEHLEVFRR